MKGEAGLRAARRRCVGLLVASVAGGLGPFLGGDPAPPVAASTSPPGPNFSAVREFIRTELGVGTNTPSVAVAVARGDAILWEEGFGWIDQPGGTPATADTLYYAASVTKAVTATALMVLHERKQLDLDRPANAYLKLARLRSPHWNADEVTLRQLATHTAGLGTYDGWDQTPGAETIRRYGIVFWRPGERFDYSNLGFGILGQIIADVSGRSFPSFVHDEVLRPLAMENAWAGATPKSRHPVAPRFSSLLRAFKPAPLEPTLPGASVFYASAHELALFGMFHLKARPPSQKPVLSPAGIGAMQDPSVPAGTRRQSLAWSIEDQHGYRTLLAQGGTYDSQAWLLLVPSEKIVVVALANAGNVGFSQAIDRILSGLLPTYRDNLAKVIAVAAATPPPATPAATPAAFVGRWSGELRTHRANLPVALAITPAGDLEATLGDQPAVKMTNVRMIESRLTARMPGDLGIDYGNGTPYELRFAVERHRDKLIGAAVTYALPNHEGPRFPFWVELKRAARAPGDR
jgi:CubicO group peptidase (beta-lactamase class C family)